MPRRIFTVTGTPAGRAAATAAHTIAAKSRRRHGSAAPPPRRVTFGTGQPKFRSTWSARSSSTTIRTAAPTTAGSTPYSCRLRGRSDGSNTTDRSVLGFRSTSPLVVTISQTYNPAPCSRHSRRNAMLVIPAMGASTTGGQIRSWPSSSGPMVTRGPRSQELALRGQLTAGIAGVDHGPRLEHQDRRLGLGDRLVVRAGRHHVHLPGAQHHVAGVHPQGQLAIDHEEELVAVLVAVPHELPVHLGQAYVVVVDRRHRPGRPDLTDLSQLLRQVDALHSCFSCCGDH